MSHSQPIKVSVIIPVYNTEKFLCECMDSVVNQTLKEIEIICVDDGSTDGSLDILRSYEQKDSRVKVLTQQNTNAGAARNKGIGLATGEYLSFLDADDFFELNMLEAAYQKAKNQKAEIVVFRSDAYDMSHNSYIEQKYTIRNKRLPGHTPFAADEVKKDIFQAFVGWAWDKLFLRDYVQRNNLFFQEQRTTNDMYFTFMAVVKAKRITLLGDLLAHHRINVKTSLEATRKYSWDCFYNALRALREGLMSAGLYERFEQDYINYCLHFSLWNLNRLQEPIRKKLFRKLKYEWFHELGVAGYPRRKFYHFDEYMQFRLIMTQPYNGMELRLFNFIQFGKNLIKRIVIH